MLGNAPARGQYFSRPLLEPWRGRAATGRVTASFNGGASLNRQEPVEVTAATGESYAATVDAIPAFIAAVTDAATQGESVLLVGVGSSSTGARAARVGCNPATGAKIQVPQRRR
ncbi:nucleoid DNA-binding protein [Paraburkholderia sp. MM5384-R2]|nr:nucleoid DNA-binding protein [Paraburkholderia sp. MM5384-R2]